MGVQISGTLIALSQYGEYCIGVETSSSKKIPKAVLYRVFGSDGSEMLVEREIKKLKFIDKIKLFFGHKDFQLKTIQRIVREVDPSSKTIANDLDYARIDIALKRLNNSIDVYNHAKTWRVFSRTSLSHVDRLPLRTGPKVQGQTSPSVVPMQAPAHDIFQEPYVDALQSIRGIANPASLCYCNSALVALFASPVFRERLSQENNLLALKLRRVFSDLQMPGPALSHVAAGALHELNIALRPLFPPLELFEQQQDSSELIAPMLDALFKTHPIVFSVVPTIERERLDRATGDAICCQSTGVPPVEAMYLPSIDQEVVPSAQDYRTNMVQVKIPENCPEFSLEDFFRGYRQLEHVEVSAIIGNEENAKWITQEKKRALILAAGANGELPPVMVSIKSCIEGTTPAVMPVYIPRFSETGEKNFTPVRAPFLLTVPVGDNRSEFYVLRSVAVHSGDNKQGGHYYTYIPDPSEVDGEGNPMRWVMASDSSPKVVFSWNDVRDDIAIQGVVFIYDKLGTS